jgi:hypothetical protein
MDVWSMGFLLLIRIFAPADQKISVSLHQPAQISMHKTGSPSADAPEDPPFRRDNVKLPFWFQLIKRYQG